VPAAIEGLPDLVRSIVGSAITVSGLTAILLTLAIPEPRQDASRES
jgi:xanthine permease XanP